MMYVCVPYLDNAQVLMTHELSSVALVLGKWCRRLDRIGKVCCISLRGKAIASLPVSPAVPGAAKGQNMSLTSFASLYEFARENQSSTAKPKPTKLTRKFGDQSVSQTLPVDPTAFQPAEVITAAGQAETVVSFSTPVGASKAGKAFTLSADASALLAADLIGTDVGSLPVSISKRSQSVETNGVHA
jgi:hypothetical protein